MEILNHPLFILGIFSFIGVEYFISRKKGLNNFNSHEMISSAVFISVDKAIELLTKGDTPGILVWLWKHRIFEMNFGVTGNFIITFFAVELAYYLAHRYNHHVNIGWATHIMHHAPTKYNLTMGYRLGITRILSLSWLIFLPLIVLGCHPNDVLLILGVTLLYQFFIHTELFPQIGFLDKIFNTPSCHRVHHSSNREHYNKNLGGITMLFDHLFGTYHAEGDRTGMKYGIPSVMNKKSIWYEISCHWKKVIRQFRLEKSIKKKFLVLFGSSAQTYTP